EFEVVFALVPDVGMTIVAMPEPLIVTPPLIVVNVGMFDPLPRSSCPDVGAEVTCNAPAPLPKITPFEVKLVPPVPPLPSGSVPVISDAPPAKLIEVEERTPEELA